MTAPDPLPFCKPQTPTTGTKQKSLFSFFQKPPSTPKAQTSSVDLSAINATWVGDEARSINASAIDNVNAASRADLFSSSGITPTANSFRKLDILQDSQCSASSTTPLATRQRSSLLACEANDSDDDIVLASPKKLRKKLAFSDDSDSEDAPTVKPLREIQENKIDLANFTYKHHISSTEMTGPSILAARSVEKPRLDAPVDDFIEDPPSDQRYEWLLHPKDSDGKSHGDPTHNPRTLFIPQHQWAKFTPFERQFWEIKSKYYDTVVFFKKGKFFELYENDAEVGSREFDLKLTDRVNMKMVGVPEASFDHWARKFIAAGYKVARVDQLENSVGKSIREKDQDRGKKEPKIIRRELTSILTAGTLVEPSSDMATYCIAIKENSLGIFCVITDTSTSEIFLSEISKDQETMLRFETLLVQLKPREIIYEKSCLDSSIIKLIRQVLETKVELVALKPGTEYWKASKAVTEIKSYFSEGTPAILDEILSCNNEGMIEAFGALIHYLRLLKLDHKVLSSNKISMYNPLLQKGRFLVLDGQTIANLELFCNLYDGSDAGSLFSTIDYTKTAFGKRLLKRWLMYPLAEIESISERQAAILELSTNSRLLTSLQELLASLPDLERLFSRMAAGSCKVIDFLKVLQCLQRIISSFGKNLHFSSCLLQFPLTATISSFLDAFMKKFDQRKAQDEGLVFPTAGSSDCFDALISERKQIQQKLDEYIAEVRLKFPKSAASEIKYKDINNTLFQLELPIHCKPLSPDWTLLSKTSKIHRFWTCETKELVKQYEIVQERIQQFCDNYLVVLLSDFKGELWQQLVQFLGVLDCIQSLVMYKERLGPLATLPEIVADRDGVFIAEEFYHPCLVFSTSFNFIPNDLSLGAAGSESRSLILTGANMGGKSTLLRQISLCIILAQLGSYLPAAKLSLSLYDRLFTRLGASDNLTKGQSTFMLELLETSTILKEATSKSLVILDELGRGTSTVDGMAIAYSVLHHLIVYVRCLTLFSTHYRELALEISHAYPNNSVSFYMDCITTDDELGDSSVIFLYKLAKGIAPQSYALNVARMALLPLNIIDIAKTLLHQKESSGKASIVGRNGSISLTYLLDALVLLNGSCTPTIINSIITNFKSITY